MLFAVLRFAILFSLYFRNVLADYIANTGYPTSNCQGTPYTYTAGYVNPCTIPDGPRVTDKFEFGSQKISPYSIQDPGYYESIKCINSTSWVRYGYDDSSCTTPTRIYNETGYECTQNFGPGYSQKIVCVSQVFVRPTIGLVVSNIARRDSCLQQPITVWQAIPDTCVYISYNQQGFKYFCNSDTVRRISYSDPNCMGSVLEIEEYNYGCNLTIPYSAPRLLDCFDVPDPLPPSSSAPAPVNIAVIAGAVGGALAFIAIVATTLAVYYQRRVSNAESENIALLTPRTNLRI
jgi:hypothetical protein